MKRWWCLISCFTQQVITISNELENYFKLSIFPTDAVHLFTYPFDVKSIPNIKNIWSQFNNCCFSFTWNYLLLIVNMSTVLSPLCYSFFFFSRQHNCISGFMKTGMRNGLMVHQDVPRNETLKQHNLKKNLSK